MAGRFEHYSDFGDAEVGKFTARYDFNSMFAIRGTVSNGFRAPTLAEEHYSGTNVSPYSAEVQLPPNSAAAQSAGFQPLRPEQSQNYSVGFVVHPIENAQITLDAYQINLHDRILVSGFIYGTRCTAGSASVISEAFERHRGAGRRTWTWSELYRHLAVLERRQHPHSGRGTHRQLRQ